MGTQKRTKYRIEKYSFPGEDRELGFKEIDGEKRKRTITHGFLGTQQPSVPLYLS